MTTPAMTLDEAVFGDIEGEGDADLRKTVRAGYTADNADREMT